MDNYTTAIERLRAATAEVRRLGEQEITDELLDEMIAATEEQLDASEALLAVVDEESAR